MNTKTTSPPILPRVAALLSLFWLAAVAPLPAQHPTVGQQIVALLRSAKPVSPPAAAQGPPAEPERSALTSDGYLRYLGAPPARHFPVANAVPGKPQLTARNFLRQHGRAFGVTSPNVDFTLLKERASLGRDFVRFQQTFAGMPVFSAQVTVQVSAEDGVECVLSDIERNTQLLDWGSVSLIPQVTVRQALERVRQLCDARTPRVPIYATLPELVIFAPSVLGSKGPMQLAWKIDVGSETVLSLNRRFLLDAHSGQVIRDYPRFHGALERRIHDANNTDSTGTLVRSEGEAATGDADVDDAYDYFGHVYWFYRNHHGRDSFNGDGCSLEVTVRYCNPNWACPMANAYYASRLWPSDDRFYIGQGYGVEDVIAHEYTHGVTDHESDLNYENASGAINESFSDVWGEFVDLSYSGGNDTNSVRWFMGEDVPGGALRNMQDPPQFSDPDRRNSPFYVAHASDPNEGNDYGGVHSNCGVNNKLCYLLTDGDTFNGQTIFGMGIARVADLYYLVNSALLGSGADWTDLYNALTQAAVNLGWTAAERNNLYRACVAVEIASGPRAIYVDKENNCLLPNGSRNCIVGYGGPFITIARGLAEAWPGDNLFIRAGSYHEAITFDRIMTIQAYDGPVSVGP